jgi:hypothetical protein
MDHNNAVGGTKAMVTQTLRLASGSTLTITLVDDSLLIVRDAECQIQLLREEAWLLAEALDDLATTASGVEGPPAPGQE